MRKKEPYKQDWTFMFSLNYFLLPSHLHWVITLLFQDTNQEAKLQAECDKLYQSMRDFKLYQFT